MFASRLILTAAALSLVCGGLGLAQDAAAPPKPPAPPAAPLPQPPPAPLLAPTPPASVPEPAVEAPSARAPSGPPVPPPPPKPPPEPLKRPRFNAAILQGVDKITAETLRFEVKVGEPVRYKGLILTVHACESTAADEDFTDSFAHLEVQSQPEVLQGRTTAPPRLIFKGWMFASSPTLHPFEHPIYDLWLIACKTASPGA